MSRVERNQALYSEPIHEVQEKPKKKSSNIGGRILGFLGNFLMVLVIAACLSIVIPKLAGYSAYVVVSGSMEPAIPVGSLVYSKEVDPATLETGDVIVFVDPARGTTPITHRVVTNDIASGQIITKGDANEHQDIDPATYDNIIGKVVVHIARIGFTAAMLTSTFGKIIAGLILLEAWLLIEISRRTTKRN